MFSPETLRWTVADLDLFTDEGKRYEIVGGELFVTRAPHWNHQNAAVKIASALTCWSEESQLGEVAINPGLVFSETDSVIADVVWASYERLPTLLDESGHLTAAPELVVEVLSPGEKNERRDREAKVKLYSAHGVIEYWIADRPSRQLEIYRRDLGRLKLAVTLYADDEITSPILPGFKTVVGQFF